MATIGSQDYTNFRAVNLRGSVNLRFVDSSSGAAGTFRVELSEGVDRAFVFPNKSGTFPISGTFSVDLPAITANAIASTTVTVTGIRSEDGLSVTPQTTYTSTGTRGVPVVVTAVPGNGNIVLQMAEVVGTATIPITAWVFGYTAVR